MCSTPEDAHVVHSAPSLVALLLEMASHVSGKMCIVEPNVFQGVPEPHHITFTFAGDHLNMVAVETLNDDVEGITGKQTM